MLSLGVLAAAMGALSAAASASRVDFTGAEACGECHQAIYRRWRTGPHARAGDSLGSRRPARRCLTCHSTGDAPLGDAYFTGVQCEACHGAGAAYAPDDIMRDRPLALALGLRDLRAGAVRERLCRGCHSGPGVARVLDVAAAWGRIGH